MSLNRFPCLLPSHCDQTRFLQREMSVLPCTLWAYLVFPYSFCADYLACSVASIFRIPFSKRQSHQVSLSCCVNISPLWVRKCCFDSAISGFVPRFVALVWYLVQLYYRPHVYCRESLPTDQRWLQTSYGHGGTRHMSRFQFGCVPFDVSIDIGL